MKNSDELVEKLKKIPTRTCLKTVKIKKLTCDKTVENFIFLLFKGIEIEKKEHVKSL